MICVICCLFELLYFLICIELPQKPVSLVVKAKRFFDSQKNTLTCPKSIISNKFDIYVRA